VAATNQNRGTVLAVLAELNTQFEAVLKASFSSVSPLQKAYQTTETTEHTEKKSLASSHFPGFLPCILCVPWFKVLFCSEVIGR
jgi:hypothetical protein